MILKTVKDIKDLKNKRVLLTCDFNISLVNGNVANDTRIIESLPTINYLLSKGAKIILVSHLGRPRGKVIHALSLAPVAKRINQLTKRKVHLISDFWEQDVLKKLDLIPSSDLILLENIRFTPMEEKNHPDFSRHLASMADYFVNDAFGASHRVHSSIVGIAQYLPACAGFLMAKEVEMLSHVLESPKRPFVVFIGGAKTPEKIAVIEKLLDLADTIALGGAIANTFLAAWGFGMGKSLVDYEMIEMARVVFWKSTRKHSALILPDDVVIANGVSREKPHVYDYNKVPPHAAIYDIGPRTRSHYCDLIKKAKTVIWNGPMGFYEDIRFKAGTDHLLNNISEHKPFSIIGGGDTLSSIKNEKYFEKITHFSTGGSAMLAFLEKGTLPGVEVLRKRKS